MKKIRELGPYKCLHALPQKVMVTLSQRFSLPRGTLMHLVNLVNSFSPPRTHLNAPWCWLVLWMSRRITDEVLCTYWATRFKRNVDTLGAQPHEANQSVEGSANKILLRNG